MEEQIKRFKSIELPAIELEDHHTALKQALLKKIIESNQKKNSTRGTLTDHISDYGYGLSQRIMPRQPAVKVLLISGVTIAMMFLILLTVVKPSFLVGTSDIAKATKLLQNSLQVKSALGGADIASIIILGTKDHKTDAIVTGTNGKSVTTNVDLEQKTIRCTITITFPSGSSISGNIGQIGELLFVDRNGFVSDEDKAKAISIAKEDPLSSSLFVGDTIIKDIYPVHVLALEITSNYGQTVTATVDKVLVMNSEGLSHEYAPVIVEVDTTKGVQSILVDLDNGKVIRIIPGTVIVGSPTITITP